MVSHPNSRKSPSVGRRSTSMYRQKARPCAAQLPHARICGSGTSNEKQAVAPPAHRSWWRCGRGERVGNVRSRCENHPEIIAGFGSRSPGSVQKWEGEPLLECQAASNTERQRKSTCGSAGTPRQQNVRTRMLGSRAGLVFVARSRKMMTSASITTSETKIRCPDTARLKNMKSSSAEIQARSVVRSEQVCANSNIRHQVSTCTGTRPVGAAGCARRQANVKQWVTASNAVK